MKKALPYIITFVTVLVAVMVAQSFSTIQEVDETGKPIADGKKYKVKYFGKKK